MTDPGTLPGGGEGAAGPERFELDLPSDLRVIEQTVSFLVLRCREHAFNGSRLLLNFRVGVTEALANAILYGNRRDPDKRIRVAVSLDQQAVEVEVRDEGSGFDPRHIPDPTLPENLERPRGRGIFLIRKLMDEVHYDEQGNCVRLRLNRMAPEGHGSTP